MNTADATGFTALMDAAGDGDRNAAMVELLIRHGAAVNVQSGDTVEIVKNGPIALGHLTPLQIAAGMANYEAVEALVKAGADVNAKDVRNATPLVFAVATDRANPKIVALLLAKGARREPALDWARRYRDPAILPLLGLAPPKLAAATPAAGPSRDARKAVAKALAASQGSASKFLAAGGCVSCHAQHLNGLAVSQAKSLGIHADYELEARQARVTAVLRGGLEQQLFQVQDPAAGVDGLEFSLIQMARRRTRPHARHRFPRPPHRRHAAQRRGLAHLRPRPPAARGRRIFPHRHGDSRAARLRDSWPQGGIRPPRRPRRHIGCRMREPRTTEDRSMQILGLAWAGRSVPSNLVQQLAAQQGPDGGWGQTVHLPADAYASGEALWALHESGMPASGPVYRRGVDYLLRTQQADGSWHVVTRALGFQPYFQSGFPYGHDQWISQAGTAMAAIGLTFAANPRGAQAVATAVPAP